MPSSTPLWCAPLLLVAALWASQSQDGPLPARERDWKVILGRTQGQRPNPRPKIRWGADFEPARELAAREGRPLFVVMRCTESQQFAAFDAAVEAGEGPLEPLLRQFICVRLTNIQDVDLRQFPMPAMQDLDLAWWAWFLSPEGQIYGVFGGMDEKGDRSRIGVPALAAAMGRVLDHHWDPRRADWNVDIAPLRGERTTPFGLPGFPSWARKFAGQRPLDCLRCHQVAEVARQPALDAGKFDKRSDLFVWPYPENVGIELVREDGLRVANVKDGSPAALAGLMAGDRLGAAWAKKLFSQTDLRVALQRIPPGGGKLVLRWVRAREVMEGTLELAPGWKQVELGWRRSVADGNIGAHPGFPTALPIGQDERTRLGIPPQTMALRASYEKSKDWGARRAGLLNSDVVLSINDQSPDLSGREFVAWFRTHFEPGEKIVLRVKNQKGEVREIVYPATSSGR